MTSQTTSARVSFTLDFTEVNKLCVENDSPPLTLKQFFDCMGSEATIVMKYPDPAQEDGFGYLTVPAKLTYITK